MHLQCVVVEDDNTLQTIYKYILQRAQFDVTFAQDGQLALDVLQVMTPQLIFLDMRLPRVDGLTVLRYIRSDDRFANTRVIVTSSLEHYERDVLVEEFILKPIHAASITQIATDTRDLLLKQV